MESRLEGGSEEEGEEREIKPPPLFGGGERRRMVLLRFAPRSLRLTGALPSSRSSISPPFHLHFALTFFGIHDGVSVFRREASKN